MKYTTSHEWVEDESGGRMGITAYAAEAMGDIVFVEFLVAEGDRVEAGQAIAEVESVKSSAQAYAPSEGFVEELNRYVVDDPSLVNADAEGEGHLLILSGLKAEGLMDEETYQTFCENEG
ncbi:glycine cleavage system protein H [bacterium]|nr:glycine cleavage system protein H [bacterium]